MYIVNIEEISKQMKKSLQNLQSLILFRSE